ncbi:MAG: hypothetical protein IT302_08365 [Dehalococcoidia bacterium]|nr:hypothetical protein [Dehalococcoidia bacterium]
MYWLFVVGDEWFISRAGRPEGGRTTGLAATVTREELLARMRKVAPGDRFVVIEEE